MKFYSFKLNEKCLKIVVKLQACFFSKLEQLRVELYYFLCRKRNNKSQNSYQKIKYPPIDCKEF